MLVAAAATAAGGGLGVDVGFGIWGGGGWDWGSSLSCLSVVSPTVVVVTIASVGSAAVDAASEQPLLRFWSGWQPLSRERCGRHCWRAGFARKA